MGPAGADQRDANPAVPCGSKELTAGSLSIHRPGGRFGDTEPLLPPIAGAWSASFRLCITALGAGVAVGLLLAALSLGTRLGRSLSVGLSVAGLALPDFFLIVLGQMATIWTYREFGVRLWSVLGAQGAERGWLLPLVALSIGPMAYTARLTATALDEVMREDYIRTARAKGIHEIHVILGHALRNVAPRVLDGLPALLNATSLVIVEVLTASPGLGTLFSGGRLSLPGGRAAGAIPPAITSDASGPALTPQGGFARVLS